MPSFCLSLFRVSAGTNMSHGNIPLGKFQWENALRHSNRVWSIFLWSQKSNNCKLIFTCFPWIPALPGLLKGNKTQANNTIWLKTLPKKPRVRTLAKPYWKPLIFIPLNQSSNCLPSASIIIFLEVEGKRLFCTFIPRCSGFSIR